MPVRTAAAPAFTAGLCEGTEYTPSEQMLDISGIRLDHYNDGNIVPMYGTTDLPGKRRDAQKPSVTAGFK